MEMGTYRVVEFVSSKTWKAILREAHEKGLELEDDPEILVRVAPDVEENPAQVYSDAEFGADQMCMGEVAELRYKHADDGNDYVHRFGPGVEMWATPDGTAILEHTGDRPIWSEFDV